ncbi:MAG TPA: SurA N-terminal domain-containing protein [Chloroflexia bacterium]|nr:SurA N-terminal domain-containing protein [Chloroflexia bacterium]
MNPYEILNISANAGLDEIEDAYDTLFDEYEPQARSGDPDAVRMLHTLNEARDTLVDPDLRAQVDAGLAEKATPKVAQPSQRPAERARPTPVTKPPAPERGKSAPPAPRAQQSRRPAQQRGGNAGTRARSRGSYMVQEPARPRRTWVSYLPYFLAIAVLGFGIALGISYLQNKGSCVPADLPTGPTVATVNGTPIYQRDWDERANTDQQNVLSDPLFAAFFNSTTVTGTRALDALKFDSLDKLINMEIIQQQARKEGVYPTDDQQKTLVDQAYASDRQGNESFDDMLCRLHVSEAKYKSTIIQNIVYTVMANQHMPTAGTSDSKTDAFINWICTTRQSYDVKILATFLVQNNPSCTSGLPSDLRLPGLNETPVPDELPTAAVPAQVNPTVTTSSASSPVPVETASPTN